MMKQFLLLMMFLLSAFYGWAQGYETVKFSEQGWQAGMGLAKVTVKGTACKVSFVNQGGNYGDPSTDGICISLFGRNAMKIDSKKTIVKVVFTFGKGKPRTKVKEDGTTDVNYTFSGGDYSESTRTWTGAATTLTIAKRKGRGQIDIANMEIYYQ